jgi:hypothetical protein
VSDPINLMYSAILQISFVSAQYFEGDAAISRIKDIADAALKEMNCRHTKLVQNHVFEIGVR